MAPSCGDKMLHQLCHLQGGGGGIAFRGLHATPDCCCRSVKTYAYRNFARLGFLMMLGHRSGIVTLYRMLFFIVAVALSVLNGILIVVGYAHTSWMFTSAAAERYMYNRK